MKDSELVARLGQRIQALRKSEKLTLEQLAQHSNVSRSMLSQIERGLANPTFATLWNLSKALGIEWADLMGEGEARLHTSIESMRAEQTPRIGRANSGCQMRILSPAHLVGQIEWYELTVQPNAQLDSPAHARGCQEHLTVLQGQLTVHSAQHSLALGPGDTARYPGDVDHCIANSADHLAQALLVVLNPQQR